MDDHEGMFAQLEQRVQGVLNMLQELRTQNKVLQAEIASLKHDGNQLRQTIEGQSRRIEELLVVETEAGQLRAQKADVRDQLARIISMLDTAGDLEMSESTATATAEAEEDEDEEIAPASPAEVPVSSAVSDHLREPLTPDEVAELAPEIADEDDEPFEVVLEGEIEPEPGSEDEPIEAESASRDDPIEVELQDVADEPELADIFEVQDLRTGIELLPEEQSALGLIYQHQDLEESELQEHLEEQGFSGIRVKNVVDRIIEKSVRADQPLVQMHFERGKYYYRRHPDARGV